MTTPHFGGHNRGTERSPELFADYAPYLEGVVWPSIDNGKREEYVAVEDMPPNRAAPSLAKLVRWARQEPTGELSLVDDPDVREEYVRKTTLGDALSARALNLAVDHMHGLYGEAGQGEPVDLKQIAAEITVALGDDYPQWQLSERIGLAIHVAGVLDRLYVFRERRSS